MSAEFPIYIFIYLSVLRRDIENIKNGIGENISHFSFVIMGFILNLLIAFVYGWKLTSIAVAYVLVVLITDICIGKVGVYCSFIHSVLFFTSLSRF